jgi:DDE superfamily endonuclease
MDKSMLDLYTDYLLASFGPTTATGLSRLLDGEVSHDQVTRFLSERLKTSADLWRIVKPLLRQVESPQGVLIIDDSIEEKPYTDENEQVAWYFDAAKNRSVKGINFLTAFYQVGEVGLPVAFDMVSKTETYFDAKKQVTKRRSQQTKNALYRRLLQICVHNQLPFRFVLNDSWYASADNMKFVHLDLKKDFIFAIKENRKVALRQGKQKGGHFQAVNRLAIPEDTAQQIWLEDVPFALLLVKQVFKNEDGSSGSRYLVSSDLTLEAEPMTELFQRRWSVEVYHKSLKQNASLEKSPTKRETTQGNHLFASLCAYIKLEGLKVKTKTSPFALKSKIYISALKSAYAELVKLNPQPLAA